MPTYLAQLLHHGDNTVLGLINHYVFVFSMTDNSSNVLNTTFQHFSGCQWYIDSLHDFYVTFIVSTIQQALTLCDKP